MRQCVPGDQRLWSRHPGLKLKNRGELAVPLCGLRRLCHSLPRNFHSPSLPAPPLPNSSHFKLGFHFTALFYSAASKTPGEPGRGRGEGVFSRTAPAQDLKLSTLKMSAACLQQYHPLPPTPLLTIPGPQSEQSSGLISKGPGRSRGEVQEQGQDSEAEVNVMRPSLGL